MNGIMIQARLEAHTNYLVLTDQKQFITKLYQL